MRNEHPLTESLPSLTAKSPQRIARRWLCGALLLTLTACSSTPATPHWRGGWVKQIRSVQALRADELVELPCAMQAARDPTGEVAIVDVARVRGVRRMALAVPAGMSFKQGERVRVNPDACELRPYHAG